MFDLIFIKIFLVIVACSIAAYTDHKTGYIYNWITFPLIIIGFLFLLFESFIFPVFGYIYFLKVLLYTGIIYGVGYLFYYFGKLGGGDVKLFLGINLSLPYLNGQIFILWLLILSSLSSVLIVSIKYMYILFKKLKFKKILNILKERISKVILYLLMLIFFTYFLYYSITVLEQSIFYLFLIVPIFFGFFSVIFDKEIKNYIYLKNKFINKIEDGDVLCVEKVSKEVREKLNLKGREVLEEKDLETIKKLNLKSLPIYDNLPRFGPYILIGCILSIYFLMFLF